mgnify:CR=1 FL=1
MLEPTAENFMENLSNLQHIKLKAEKIFRISPAIVSKLTACPKLESLKITKKCSGISASALYLFRKNFEAKNGRKIELLVDEQLLNGSEELEAREKLPEKKQRMLHINSLMKRTITLWKQLLKAKALRSWRDFAFKKQKEK